MCTDGGAGYIDQASTAWVCLYFDPLDPRDAIEDPDQCIGLLDWGCGDGYDFDRDGVLEPGERFTSSEESGTRNQVAGSTRGTGYGVEVQSLE